MVPASGRSSPRISLSTTDLPAPLAPSRIFVPPRWTETDVAKHDVIVEGERHLVEHDRAARSGSRRPSAAAGRLAGRSRVVVAVPAVVGSGPDRSRRNRDRHEDVSTMLAATAVLTRHPLDPPPRTGGGTRHSTRRVSRGASTARAGLRE